ncbi:MAG: GntR family transcriptional regulator [Caenispirillum sp.]|nr:GntR family transcriptional regulator [Caenispirillum sp.]
MTLSAPSPQPADGGERAADRAYKLIREGILRQHWSGGEHLREHDLAAFTGVSRTPVRDALRRLAAEGLVELTPNAGARIWEWTTEELDDIFDLRSLMEGHAASLAAARIAPAQLAELADLCDRMEAVVEASADSQVALVELSPLNERFHGVILEASGSRRLRLALRQVIQVPLVMRTFAVYSAAELRRSMSHHREIAEALAARDGVWAESVMRSHLHAGHAVMTRGRANIDRAAE